MIHSLPQFLSTHKTTQLISQNHDYYHLFSKKDWNLRGVQNKKEYLQQIPDCCEEFTPEEKKKLQSLCKKADDFFKTIHSRYSIEWLNGTILSTIRWKFGCINDSYENGNPHTIGNTILLSKEDFDRTERDFISLLIHEKVHIFQRYYPLYIKKYLTRYQFKPYRKRTKYDNIRANPDTDRYVYERLGKVYRATYKKSAKTINDIRLTNLKNEHPFEEMAYRVEEMYKNDK
jgi:hypothetical protein